MFTQTWEVKGKKENIVTEQMLEMIVYESMPQLAKVEY